MLGELNIKNFAVIEDANIRFEPDMNIISGEEGSGKSLVVDAINTLLGTRVPSGLIRNGSSTARIEGIFWISADISNQLKNILEENAIELEDDGSLIISRELQQQGRSIARVNGKAVPASFLKQIGGYLVDMHSQMDYISLLSTHHQLELLDAYGNLLESQNSLSLKIDDLRQKIRELAKLNEIKTNGRQDLLRYQVEEIEHANLQPGEDEVLQDRREILLRAESLKESSLNAYGSLYGEERSATVLIHEAFISVKALNDSNSSVNSYKEQLESIMTNLEEMARELRRYGESIEADASQLDEIEGRIDLLNSLKRKYGEKIDEILSLHEKAKQELDTLDNHQEYKNQLEKEIESLEIEAGRQAEELSLSRRHAAKSLAGIVNEELADLGLKWTKFDISLHREEDAKGLPITSGKRFSFTREGIDHIQFMIATNPGEPMKPLATIASGGETCRIMLALKSALKRVDPIPTLVFDEIDIGIGGRSGNIVGKKLTTLAQQHQVLCITHLPQVACFGDAHIRMVKDISSGRATTKVEIMKGKKRIEELAAMLGSGNAGKVMIEGAEKLLGQAESWKKQEKERVMS